MHSCVHAWTMHVVNEGRDDGMARLALRCVGFHIPSTDELQYWVTQQRLLRHVNRSRGCIDGMLAGQDDGMTVIDAVHNLGLLYSRQGKLDKGEEMYKRALNGYEKRFGSNYPHCYSLRRALVTFRDGAGS